MLQPIKAQILFSHVTVFPALDSSLFRSWLWRIGPVSLITGSINGNERVLQTLQRQDGNLSRRIKGGFLCEVYIVYVKREFCEGSD